MTSKTILAQYSMRSAKSSTINNNGSTAMFSYNTSNKLMH